MWDTVIVSDKDDIKMGFLKQKKKLLAQVKGALKI